MTTSDNEFSVGEVVYCIRDLHIKGPHMVKDKTQRHSPEYGYWYLLRDIRNDLCFYAEPKNIRKIDYLTDLEKDFYAIV